MLTLKRGLLLSGFRWQSLKIDVTFEGGGGRYFQGVVGGIVTIGGRYFRGVVTFGLLRYVYKSLMVLNTVHVLLLLLQLLLPYIVSFGPVKCYIQPE